MEAEAGQARGRQEGEKDVCLQESEGFGVSTMPGLKVAQEEEEVMARGVWALPSAFQDG